MRWKHSGYGGNTDNIGVKILGACEKPGEEQTDRQRSRHTDRQTDRLHTNRSLDSTTQQPIGPCFLRLCEKCCSIPGIRQMLRSGGDSPGRSEEALRRISGRSLETHRKLSEALKHWNSFGSKELMPLCNQIKMCHLNLNFIRI